MDKNSLDSDEAWIATELAAAKYSDLRKRLRGRLRRRLWQLLQLSWAADWILGPGQSVGLRSRFYPRITLPRFAYCLALARYGDTARMMTCF